MWDGKPSPTVHIKTQSGVIASRCSHRRGNLKMKPFAFRLPKDIGDLKQ